MSSPTVEVRFKLYASLSRFLPQDARENAVTLRIAPGTTPNQLIDRYGVPRELSHLVLRNGVYMPPAERDWATLTDGDTLAIWPPVAGG
jgi:molybdopterin converting factor small subunit